MLKMRVLKVVAPLAAVVAFIGTAHADAPTKRAIYDLAREIEASVFDTQATTSTLESARQRMLEALSLIRTVPGPGPTPGPFPSDNVECQKFAYEKYSQNFS